MNGNQLFLILKKKLMKFFTFISMFFLCFIGIAQLFDNLNKTIKNNSDTNAVFNPNIVTVDTTSILPVKYSKINAHYTNKGILLEWYTITELNNSHFVIEKSNDAISFEEIALIPAYNVDLSSYQFLDFETTGSSYYRIKQIDVDGTGSYSEIIEVSHRSIESITSISEDQIDIFFQDLNDTYITFSIINKNGIICFSNSISKLGENPIDTFQIDLNNYSRGYYFLKVIGDQTQEIIRFFKN